MAKIVLDTIASGYNLAKINDNFTKIAAAFNDEVLYRDVPDGETNTVKNDIDMDSNNLLNVGDLRVLGTASIDGINFDVVNSALVWRGVWNSSTSYAVSDAVSYNGSSYISIASNINSAPPSSSWDVLAQQGTSGVGTGDVTGPASSTSGAIVVFASGTGKALSDSGISPSTLAVKGDIASSGITGAAHSGANSDITSLTALTSVPNGTITNLPAVAGAFKNLAASANGTSANISVSADEVVLSNASNQYVTLRSVSLTIAGTSVGANGLDAGSLATSTWYSVWVIWNGTTTAGLLSTSATSPTLPSGYTHKARVGWIRTDASGNKYPLAFKQKGRNVRHVVAAATNVTALPSIATGTATWPTAAGIGNFFPSTTAKATFQFVGANLVSGYVYLSPNANYALCCMSNSYSSGSPMYQVVDMVLESSNVYYGGNNAMSISSYGWEDNL